MALDLGQHHQRGEGVDVGADLRLHAGAARLRDVQRVGVAALDLAEHVVEAAPHRRRVLTVLRGVAGAQEREQRHRRVGDARRAAHLAAAHRRRLVALPPGAVVELVLRQPREATLDVARQRLRLHGGLPRDRLRRRPGHVRARRRDQRRAPDQSDGRQGGRHVLQLAHRRSFAGVQRGA
jgi:hypothetical protein